MTQFLYKPVIFPVTNELEWSFKYIQRLVMRCCTNVNKTTCILSINVQFLNPPITNTLDIYSVFYGQFIRNGENMNSKIVWYIGTYTKESFKFIGVLITTLCECLGGLCTLTNNWCIASKSSILKTNTPLCRLIRKSVL
jgi:hypothetical protein